MASDSGAPIRQMHVSLRQLRAFSAVARLLSFSDAARALHLTPAALSVLVRELEQAVGFRLFHRTTRRVTLSEQGQQFLEHAERVLADLRMAELAALEIRSQRSQPVRIAMTPLMYLTLLPPVFAALREREPQVQLEPVDVPAEDLLAAVEAGQADLAVSYARPAGDALEGVPLFTSRLHAVLHRAHPLAGRTVLRWSALADQPLIFIGRAMELRVRTELPASIRLNVRHAATNGVTAFALAASGAGIAIAPGYAGPIGAVHALRVLPLSHPTVDRRFMLFRRLSRAGAGAPAVDACHAFLLATFGAAGRGPIEQLRPATSA